jgi:alpha-1,2-mannosyltransferase
VIAAGAVCALILVWALSAHYTLRWGPIRDIDLQVYRLASKSWLSGHFTYTERFGPVHLAYLYPPVSLMALAWLTWFTPAVAAILAWLAGTMALVLTLWLAISRTFPSLGRVRAIAWAAAVAGAETIALEPVRSTLSFGQINLLLLALVSADLLFVTARRRGVLVGLAAAIKLVPLVFVAQFALERRWRAVLISATTLTSLTGVAWFIDPHLSSQFWLGRGIDAASRVGVGFRRNQSIFGALVRLFGRSAAADLAWLVLSLVIVALWVGIVRHSRCSPLQLIVVTSLLSTLISPIAWSHHWVWIALVPVMMLERAPTVRRLRPSLALVVIVAAIAPYRWTGGSSWLVHLEQDSLTLAGAWLMAHWFVVARRLATVLASRDAMRDAARARESL